jgi:chemotaxis protein methyltransferase CheR
MTLTSNLLRVVRQLLLERAAIKLGEDQSYLVESRLASLAKEQGCGTVSALVQRLEREPFGSLHQRVVEAMTTNETSFFRDGHPFETLKTVILPDLLLKRTHERRLRIWSAACSSGQEAYSVLMLMLDSFPLLRSWNVRVVGTDIATNMVERARKGVYSELEVGRGLPRALLQKYFVQEGTSYRVRDELRRMVEWRTMNLAVADPTFVAFDIIFLRNVLIYFDQSTRGAVFSNVSRGLRSDGYLFLGSTETPHGACTEIAPQVNGNTTFYRLSARPGEGRRHANQKGAHK